MQPVDALTTHEQLSYRVGPGLGSYVQHTVYLVPGTREYTRLPANARSRSCTSVWRHHETHLLVLLLY